MFGKKTYPRKTGAGSIRKGAATDHNSGSRFAQAEAYDPAKTPAPEYPVLEVDR